MVGMGFRRSPHLLCLVGLSIALIQPIQAALSPGDIWAVKVEGNAFVEAGARSRLVEGAKISAGATIVTEANGDVVLLFENGSTVNIRPGTRFSIKEFSCEPFDSSKIEWRSLRREPGEASRTKLQVDDGSIIANVRKLRGQSTYDIATPLGTAGIRGTTVYAEVDMQNTETPVSFGVADGNVLFTLNSGQSQGIGGGAAVGVSGQGQFTPPPANAQQMLTTAQQVGQVMSQSAPPVGGTSGASAEGAAAPTVDIAETDTQGTGASAAAGGPVALTAAGTVTFIKDGVQSEGANSLNTLITPGTIITTGEDGVALIEISPGNTIRVQPNTQITIGETVMDRAVNSSGDAIPETAVTLAVGTIVADTPPGLGAVPPEILSMIRLPFAKTWSTASPEDIRQAVLEAARRNPEQAPEIVRAAIQQTRATGRFPASGAADVKQVVEDDGDGETSLEELAAMIANAATEGSPAMAAEIASAMANALEGGLSSATFVIITPRGTITPVVGGVTIISSTGADPATSTVTVASPTGMDLVVTIEGEQLPVDEGQVVILRPDGIEYGDIEDFPDLLDDADIPNEITVILPPADLPPPNPPQPSPTPTPGPISP